MISLNESSASRRLVEALVARGCSTFFGIPGGPVCPVFEAIRLTEGARLIESRHETAAAFSAAMFHRSSGKVPVVVVTAGPGITNTMTGIASAFSERIPMLVIAGDVAWATSGKRLTQDSGLEGLNIDTMLSTITFARIRAFSSRSVVPKAMAALDMAIEKKGPSLFVLSLDHAMGDSPHIQVSSSISGMVSTSTIEPVIVSRVIEGMRAAKRPLVIVGGGCRDHAMKIRLLVDYLQAPFVTTPRAKGIIGEDHPLSLRNGGIAASSWVTNYAADGPIDFCLALGTDMDDSSVSPTYLGPGGTLVHVDRDPAVFGRNFSTSIGVVADVSDFALSMIHTGTMPDRSDLLSDIRKTSPFREYHTHCDGVHPAEAILRLQQEFPKARFITDIGEHMLFALHYLTATNPESFTIQLNLGSMGSGVAGSVGLALGAPGPVVCIVGDGCMQMHGMEVLVAIRENLPILFAVFNDGRYNMVHHGMRQIFGMAELYNTPLINFGAWAAAMGMYSQVVNDQSELNKFQCTFDGPVLLDIRTDPSAHMSGGGRIAALQRMSMTDTTVISQGE